MKNRNALWVALGLAIATLAVFWQVTGHDFINYDDDVFVTRNPHVVTGLTTDNLAWAFSTKDMDYWRPLSMISHMIDVELYGINPTGHHITNLLFHMGATILLFLALFRMTGGIWQSAFVAAMFAIHPLHVESVAWVGERKDVMYGFFWMLTLWAYARYAEHRELKWYGLVFFSIAAAMMSKPMAVTLPAALLLLDYWPLNRLQLNRSCLRTLIIEKLPFIALAIALSAITFWVVKEGGHVHSLDRTGLTARVVHAVASYATYLTKTIWPSDLAIFYPFPKSTSPVWLALSGAVLLLLSFFSLTLYRRSPALLMGWLWFLGTLLPVIGIVQAGLQSMADRYTYIPLIGIFVMIAWGIPERARETRVLKIAAVAVLCAAAIVAWSNVRHWKNSDTLFSHALQVTSENFIAHNNLAAALAARGQTDNAIAHYHEALRIYPRFLEAHVNLGLALASEGRADEAIARLQEALRIRPNHVESITSIGNALSAKGLLDEAVEQHKRALQINPEYAEAYNNLGDVFRKKGRLDEAKELFTKALSLLPEYPEAHSNLGIIHYTRGDLAAAVQAYERSLRINPNYPLAHMNLGIALATQGNLEKAIEHLKKTIQLSPRLADAHTNYGVALYASGRFDEAISALGEALRLDPSSEDVRQKLQVARSAQQKVQRKAGQ